MNERLTDLQNQLQYLLALALYTLGDWVSRPMCRWDWAWLYPIYNRLMMWSIDLDARGKIWKIHKK